MKSSVPLLDDMDMGRTSKMAVRKVLAFLALGTKQPYGTLLLLNTDKVIKTIEGFRTRGKQDSPVRGKTMLNYFVCILRVLKEMTFQEVPGAEKARLELQDYKDKNYQHFALLRGPPVKNSSQIRQEMVSKHKEGFEKNLAKV